MKKYKRNLVFSIISLVLVTATLGLSVFENGQNGFSVFRHSFFAGPENGTFDMELYWTSDPVEEEWKIIESTGNEIPFGSDILWEPDKSVVRYFKVRNAGDYDFNYNFGIDTPDSETDTIAYISEHPIGNVIDVFYCGNVNDLSSKQSVGTLNECFQSPGIVSDFSLCSGDSTVFALVFTMQHDAGNEYQGAYDGNSRLNNIGFRFSAAAYADEPEQEYDGQFRPAPVNSNQYLYRVGNGNPITADKIISADGDSSVNTNSLFAFTASAAADFDSSLVSLTCERISGTSDVGFEFTAGSGTTAKTFLNSSSFQFSGTGVIKVTMLYNGVSKAELYLEVVSGNNVESASDYNTNRNNILLNDITAPSNMTITGGRILYGNGYTITGNRTSTAGTNGLLNINNGTLDNVILNGEVYENAVPTGYTNEEYSPGVNITGDAYIYNSYISECKYAVSVERGNVFMKNTTVTGGAIANINIAGGNVTLENCVTGTSERGGLKSLAVRVVSTICSLTINGTFEQHNWLLSDDLPSNYKSYISSFYSNSTYAYTNGGKTYVNLGIMFLNDAGNITQEQAQAVITDNTSNAYGYTEKTSLGVTATLYTAKASMGSTEMLGAAGYSPNENGQYYTVPQVSFDWTTKNYIPKVEGDNNYCYYDSSTKTVNISFDKEDSSSAFSWDPMIFTATKNGSSIGYTVSMNGADYTNAMIDFSESGDYQVVYSYTDTGEYQNSGSSSAQAVASQVVYTRAVNISVTAVEPDTVIYNAAFTYVGDWANSARTVIGTDSNTYVMPDVTATSSKIGSTTAGGKTVYYPIVTVGPTSSNGNTAYSSGKGYYFAPVFSALNITDYNQETGAAQYTYNTGSTTWPHGKGQTNGPDSAVFGYAYADKTWNNYCPYARSMNAQYYKFGKNNNGLCYTSEEIEKDNTASTHLVQYHYVSNDGVTYYYYIQYSFQAMTYSQGTCIAEGTMITMADGTQKPIEEVAYKDSVLSRNFFTGETQAKNIAILVNHGKDYYSILNLEFSDGTVLRLIGDHGVFDYTLNRYVYPSGDNYKDYIGHKFIKLNEKGKLRKVKLKDAFITSEYTAAYSITSAQNANTFAQGILTTAPPDEFYNWVDMGGKMRYDKKRFDADVKKYGLYDYSVFKDYVSYETYIAFNGPYLKVAVEKGKFTFDDIIKLIELYASYMK